MSKYSKGLASAMQQPTEQEAIIAYLKVQLAETVDMYGDLMKRYFDLSAKYQKEHQDGRL